MKASHNNPKINSKFDEWAELPCRSSKLGHGKVCRNKKCNCLGTTTDYSTKSMFKVGIADYVGTIKNGFSSKTNKTLAPWNDKLFSVDTSSPRLDK